MEDFPHVARFRERIDADGACDDDRARTLLHPLRALLRILGPATRHPGLVRQNAIDSVGKYIDPAHAESVRLQLMGQEEEEGRGAVARVTLKRRSHELLSVEAYEALGDVARMRCTPIRGSDEVARRLGTDDRALAELSVELGTGGGKLVLRQHVEPLRAVVTLTMAGTKTRKTLDARLRADQRFCLDKCFAGAGVVGAVRPEPNSARALVVVAAARSGGFHELPAWMAEILASVAQDVFRLHVLTSATSQCVSRMVLVDRATVFRCSAGAVQDPRVLIKAALHPASGGCVCGLHRRESASAAAFVRIEFRVRICDSPFVPHGAAQTRVCARHFDQDDVGTHDAVEAPGVAPGRCCRGMAFELWCVHDNNNNGVRLSLPLPATWLREPLREVAMACCALTRPDVSEATVLDLKATTQGTVQHLERERMARGHVESTLQPRDQTAVWLLRNDTPRMGSDGRLKGKRVQKEFQEIVSTHSHLFKRVRV